MLLWFFFQLACRLCRGFESVLVIFCRSLQNFLLAVQGLWPLPWASALLSSFQQSSSFCAGSVIRSGLFSCWLVSFVGCFLLQVSSAARASGLGSSVLSSLPVPSSFSERQVVLFLGLVFLVPSWRPFSSSLLPDPFLRFSRVLGPVPQVPFACRPVQAFSLLGPFISALIQFFPYCGPVGVGLSRPLPLAQVRVACSNSSQAAQVPSGLSLLVSSPVAWSVWQAAFGQACSGPISFAFSSS